HDTSVTRSRTSGKARIGSTVIGSARSKSESRVLQVRLGRPSTSALHDPHLAALQFQRTARSGASWPWIQWSASRTTIPSSTGTSNSSKRGSLPGVPRKTRSLASDDPAGDAGVSAEDAVGAEVEPASVIRSSVIDGPPREAYAARDP